MNFFPLSPRHWLVGWPCFTKLQKTTITINYEQYYNNKPSLPLGIVF
jgi:hypothetical protein